MLLLSYYVHTAGYFFILPYCFYSEKEFSYYVEFGKSCLYLYLTLCFLYSSEKCAISKAYLDIVKFVGLHV